jgi:hypothetical protein
MVEQESEVRLGFGVSGLVGEVCKTIKQKEEGGENCTNKINTLVIFPSA